MAQETQKKQNVEEQAQKKAGKQAQKQAPKKNQGQEYRNFRDLTKEEIQQLPLLKVEMERIEHPRYGENVQITVHLTPQWKKQIRKTKVFDIRRYHLVVAKRDDLNPDNDHHVMWLPARFLYRYDENGELHYRRFEIAFTKNIIVSDFFDNIDDEMFEAFDPGFEFIKDKDSSNEYSISKAEDTYIHFE